MKLQNFRIFFYKVIDVLIQIDTGVIAMTAYNPPIRIPITIGIDKSANVLISNPSFLNSRAKVSFFDLFFFQKIPRIAA